MGIKMNEPKIIKAHGRLTQVLPKQKGIDSRLLNRPMPQNNCT